MHLLLVILQTISQSLQLLTAVLYHPETVQVYQGLRQTHSTSRLLVTAIMSSVSSFL